MLNFKSSTLEDITALLNIEKHCFPIEIQFTKETYMSLFKNKDNIIDFIMYNDEAIGVVAVAVRKYTGIFFAARLCNLAIIPEYQSKGLAKQTLEIYLNRLSHFHHVFLEVEMNNEKAVRLYEKCGFKHYKTIKNYYGLNKHALKMKKVFPVLNVIRAN